MALGSVLALLVAAAAAIEGPKLMRGGATDAQGVPAPAAMTANPAPAATQTPDQQTSPSAPPAAEATRAPVSMPPAAPVQQPVPAQYAFRPAQAPPVQAPQTAPAAQPAPAPAPPPVTGATASPELKELRDRINRVAVRAAAAQAGVRSIEQGIQAQGYGLRGDIKAASIRLDYVLQEARASLQNGDVEGARNNLQYAEGTLDKIEKFLGQ